MKIKIFLILFTLFLFSPFAHSGDQGSLQTCQHIQGQIDKYTSYKRAGGSSSQMNSWQKQRNKYKTLFSEYNCKVYRGKL